MRPWNRPNDCAEFLLEFPNEIVGINAKDEKVLTNGVIKFD